MLASPVLLFDPVHSLEASPRGAHPTGGPQFAQAYGLALRTA
jgi:hypothetical protein